MFVIHCLKQLFSQVRPDKPVAAGTHVSHNKKRISASQRFDRIYQKLSKAGKEPYAQLLK